ncbi:protein FAM53B [Alligator mississippiensis]|uniref:Protein FAM53B n=1 Tax=Alligator mississippiensis TaxID=8496 RepID=A0A151P476_ALLMI|nr:protein FAM53B [Alligator mississippiensis]
MHDFITMVMILTKTLENKGAESVTCRTELHTPKMSQGPTLFSCGIMENDRWRDLSRKCPLQIEQPSSNIWDCLPDKNEEGSIWQRDTVNTCSVTNLIKDLSLSDHNANSTPASTPELMRRSNGLSRSRSQPCVLNDKKVGVKRRRPEEVQEQRPSLDLAKMTQNRQTFNSLSCLSTPVDDCALQTQFCPSVNSTKSWTTSPSSSDVMPGRTPACTPVPEPHSNAEECRVSKEDLSCEESDYCATEEESSRKEEERASWRSSGTGGENVFQLDGELDIEQIENN